MNTVDRIFNLYSFCLNWIYQLADVLGAYALRTQLKSSNTQMLIWQRHWFTCASSMYCWYIQFEQIEISSIVYNHSNVKLSRRVVWFELSDSIAWKTMHLKFQRNFFSNKPCCIAGNKTEKIGTLFMSGKHFLIFRAIKAFPLLKVNLAQCQCDISH